MFGAAIAAAFYWLMIEANHPGKTYDVSNKDNDTEELTEAAA